MKTVFKIVILMTSILISSTYVMGQKRSIRIPYDCKYEPKEYPKNLAKLSEWDLTDIALLGQINSANKAEYKHYLDKFQINYRYGRDEEFEYTLADTVFQDIVYKCNFFDNTEKILTIDGIRYDGSSSLSKYRTNAPFQKKIKAFAQDKKEFEKEKNLFVTRYLKYEDDYLKFTREEAVKDSLKAIEQAKREAAEEAARKIEQQRLEKVEAERQRRKVWQSLQADISDPAKPLQTKTTTNAAGAKVTYQYYINDNGYEVKHGKYTVTMTFKNYTFWTGSQYGYAHLNGTESCTYYYKNGILHGRVTYSSDVSASATFGNDELLKNNISFDVYKGVITGNFKFSYKGITYTGKATKGILDYCDYETRDGYHGKLTSNSASKNLEIAIINNGSWEFELNDGIKLEAFICNIPAFCFPRIGK